MDSVIHQTFTDFEAICIDDGSTDGSGRILDEYARRDSRITVIHQNNRGVAHARNRGFEASAGEYILFLDPDDYLSVHALEKTYSRVKKYDADICIFDAQDFDCETGNFLLHYYFNRSRAESMGNIIETDGLRYYLFDIVSIACWVKLVRRTLLTDNDIRFEPREIFEDTMWSALSIALSKKITTVPEKLVFHRVNRKGSLLNSVDKNFKDPAESYRNTYEALSARGVFSDDVRRTAFLNKTAVVLYYTLRSFSDYHRVSEYWDIINGKETILYENGPYPYNPKTPALNNYMKWRDSSIDDFLFFKYKEYLRIIGTRRQELSNEKEALGEAGKSLAKAEKANTDLTEENRILHNDNRDLVNKNEELDEKNRSLQEEIKKAQEKIAAVSSSKSFRLGQAMLYIPEKIKKLFR
jgi:glycosyltransferase involved in cell wall biosynthesis